jgi:hypothetical protein
MRNHRDSSGCGWLDHKTRGKTWFCSDMGTALAVVLKIKRSDSCLNGKDVICYRNCKGNYAAWL